MKTLSPKPISNYLSTDDNDLQYIFAKAEHLKKINQKVNLLLDPAFAAHCHVANIKENKMIIMTANASIATQLRYHTEELLKKFKQDDELKKIDMILCKVSPNLLYQKQEIPVGVDKMPLLSLETSKIIKEIANTIKDSKLKATMERIATHIKET